MPQPSARDLRILNAIAEALNSAPDLPQALERTLLLVTDLLELHSGWIWVRDADSGRYYQAGARNLPPYLQDPVRMTGSICWCLGACEAGELTPRNVDVMECSRLRPAVKRRQTRLTNGLAWHASIPLSFQGRALGILNVAAPSWRRLTARQMRLLTTIGYQVGMALERARLATEEARRVRVEERTRLARDLHDSVAQGLTAITLQVEAALNRPEKAQPRLEAALSVARQSLEEVRRTVSALRTLPQGLSEALGALARGFTSRTGIPVRLHVDAALVLAPDVESELYRMAQEMLSNIERHAAAHHVDMALKAASGKVRLKVQDDGRGFVPGPVAGHGLIGLRERARLIGAKLRLTTAPGEGTRVEVTLSGK